MMLQDKLLKLYTRIPCRAWLASAIMSFCCILPSTVWAAPDEPSNYISQDESQSPPDGNLWTLLQQSFDIPQAIQNQPGVQSQIQWFLNHQDYLYGIAVRASPYLYYIYQQTIARKLPPALILLPFVESAYDPFVSSSVGAAGLWQIMPNTGTGFGIKQDWWYDGRRDVISSTNAALDYLSYLDNYFGGDWLLALAAYDAGEGTVEAAIHKNESEGKPTNFWALDLPQETELYVPRIVALATIISNPDQYPVRLPYVKATPYLAQVDTGTQIGLAEAAQLAGISLAEVYQLNPGYRHGATDPDGPYRIVLPITKVSEFEAHLAARPHTQWASTQHYVVKPGDTLSGIAEKYKISVNSITMLNQIHHNLIHAGEKLIIPSTDHIPPDNLTASLNPYGRHATREDDLSHPHKIKYKVHSGDSLWSIAKTYHVSIDEIIAWNHLRKNRALRPGSTLKLWTEPTPTVAAAQPTQPYLVTPTTSNTSDNDNDSITAEGHPTQGTVYMLTYNVRKDDSLASIAHSFHVNASDIEKWNKLADNTALQPGQVLKIYTPAPPT